MKKTLMGRNIWIFCKKELNSYFNSLIAYVVILIFLLIASWFFTNSLFLINQADPRNLFGVIPLIFLFFVPAITMRLISEEKKTGTIEVLVTLPLRDGEIILGKFLASLILLSVAILLTLIHVLTLSGLGDMDWGGVMGGYLGLILMGATYLSVGIFTSSLTQNQIISFITSFVIIFIFFMLDKILFFIPGFLTSFFEYLSVDYHFSNIARGVIDTRDLIYYFSIIGFFLFLAVRTLESRKWR